MAMLPPEILASAADVTLPNLVAAQERLEAEAREAMPYSFDECTYARGAIRQSVWSCLDCGQKGVCYGCSISCHSEHRLVELWTKRGFTCDCPTEGGGACAADASATAGPSTVSARSKCTLTRGDAQPRNESNTYSHNFAGEFCRCGRDYDPETETEAMIHCIGCEDWFHESCLNLAPRLLPRPADGDDGANSDDDETRSLIPSESYDGLVCGACAAHPFVAARKGTPGWMIVVWDGAWCVRGRGAPAPASRPEESEGKPEQDSVATAGPMPGDQPRPAKRPSVDDGPDAKRVRVDAGAMGPGGAARCGEEVLVDEPSEGGPSATTTMNGPRIGAGAGDVFLAHGVRDRLRETLDSATAASLPFPLVDEEIYEPPADTDEPESLDDLTQRVVGTLPRVQAIEALHGYQAMKDKLKVMLAGHVASGEAVSRADIEAFFDELRAPARG